MSLKIEKGYVNKEEKSDEKRFSFTVDGDQTTSQIFKSGIIKAEHNTHRTAETMIYNEQLKQVLI